MPRRIIIALLATIPLANAAPCSGFELARGDETCDAAEPSWVQKFSVAADGPEQLWINYGRAADEMVIGWVTADMTAPSTVEYGTESGTYTDTASGTNASYTYSASYTSGLIHHTTLKGLKEKTTYYYRVGDAATGYSYEANFTLPGVGPTYPFVIGSFADVGESNNAANTLSHLLLSSDISMFILNGDLSYASGCEKSGCTTWDAWGRMLEPLAAFRPVSINIGNHENDDYANGIIAISAIYRYAGMPFPEDSPDGANYFSYNAGPVHVISLASFFDGGFGGNSRMTAFLKADLAALDRTVTPWVIVQVHAPWYNSNTKHQGDGEDMRVAYEPLLIAAGVNAVFSGHVHAYERSTPVDDNKVVADGEGMVHFNTGDGGASLYTKWITIPDTSAYHSAEFGYSKFTIVNASHAHFEWLRNVDDEKVVTDDTWVINKAGLVASA